MRTTTRRAAFLVGLPLVAAAVAGAVVPHALAAEKHAPPGHHPVLTPALPPCDAYPTPPPGTVTLVIPALPGRNCTPR